MVARLLRVEEQLDDLSIEVQDCLYMIKEMVTTRTQASIKAMNARLESFFVYQVEVNQ